ncbi:MAG: M48 family metallopeptidase [Pseudanabaenaceae cyanobacterium bins.68]|nr:M48 family metallopeptidase [Pseudanabaenaceae cyanobacterium bins.68]
MSKYPGISSEAFRHPLDQQAEASLRSVPGFDFVARKFVEFLSERPQQIYNLGNYIQVGPRQYSTLYRLFREAVSDLDLSPEPTLFVAQNPLANAYSLGKDHPYIVVHSGVLDLLTEPEIKTVIAHEIGHIKCGHTILIQMAIWTMNAIAELSERTFGLGGLISSGLIFAFFEWRRKAELSSDRAALLVIDDLDTVIQTMMKISGGSDRYRHELSMAEFIRQSETYQELDRDSLNQIYKFLLYNGFNSGMMLSHPFPVERVHYLQQWAASAQYQQIRQGNYSQQTSGVEVKAEPDQAQDPAEELRQQIERLQAEINRVKGENS